MKTITINVSEPTYRWFKEAARNEDRSTSELIRVAMDEYRKSRNQTSSSLRYISPSSVGRVKKSLSKDDDLLAEMLK